ncbi:hypothetical protein PHMEG_00018583, partial [Phytophthora megakarya]
MLRKLFHSGGARESTSSSINSDATKKTEADGNGNRDTEFAEMVERLERFEADGNGNRDTEFAETVERLERFEAGLKDTINKLSRHCQAICEMVASSRELGSCVHNLYGGEEDEHQATASEARKLLSDVGTFRTSSIAPLQTILAGIPQLKVKCDHRNSAKSVALRYERKNRTKHHVALERFKEIDKEVVADVAAVLANDLPEISSQAIEKLLLQHQVITAQWMQAEVT